MFGSEPGCPKVAPIFRFRDQTLVGILTSPAQTHTATAALPRSRPLPAGPAATSVTPSATTLDQQSICIFAHSVQ
jgi:hypothetical protein